MSESSPPPKSGRSTPVGKSKAADEHLLQKSLKAFQQQDYAAAVADLQTLSARTAFPAYRLKAQMGLVRAYERMGERQAAIAICQQLINHSNPQIHAWADQAMARLSAVETATVEQSKEKPIAALDTLDAPPPATQADLSGFTPLEPQPPSPAPISATEALPGGNKLAADDRLAVPPVASPDQPQSTDIPSVDQGGSLFDYRVLNQGVAPEEKVAQIKDPAAQGIPANREATGAAPMSSASADAETPPPPLPERYERLSTPKALPPVSPLRRWAVELVTAIALFWVIRVGFHGLLEGINWVLGRTTWPVRLRSLEALSQDYSWIIGFILLGLTLSSPWLLDGFLKAAYDQRTLSFKQLKTVSPEAATVLRRVCQQRGWNLPELRLIHADSPVIFSYGWLARNLRIVVSQGLLDQFESEELATLYAYEMGDLLNPGLPVLNGLGTGLLLLHQGYWRLALWGDRLNNLWLRTLVGALANALYGLFWLLRKLGLWLSRVRSGDCDRAAAELTGNPHGHRRSLLKLMRHIAMTVEQAGQTPPLLESTDLLMPLSPQMALTPGSALGSLELSDLLLWDRQNPYRHWLVWNDSHPLLGERLQALDRYALRLGLPPQDSAVGSNPAVTTKVLLKTGTTGSRYLPSLLAQGSPIFGLLLGLGIALLLWFIGGVFNAFNWYRISWLYQDTSVLKGGLLLGFGIGTLARINRLFPDIQLFKQRSPALDMLIKNPQRLPIDGPPVRVEGVLLGRRGVANWLCQDLFLKTSIGSIRLHALSALGPLGNFIWRDHHPTQRIGQSITLTGWFRRGTTPWIDVAKLSLKEPNFSFSSPPLWSTLMSLVACLWGILILFRGG